MLDVWQGYKYYFERHALLVKLANISKQANMKLIKK